MQALCSVFQSKSVVFIVYGVGSSEREAARDALPILGELGLAKNVEEALELVKKNKSFTITGISKSLCRKLFVNSGEAEARVRSEGGGIRLELPERG